MRADNDTTESLWADFIVGPDSAATSFHFAPGHPKDHAVILSSTRAGMSFVKTAMEKLDDRQPAYI